MTMAHTGKAPFSGTLETSVCHQMYRCTAQESCRRAQQANAKRDYLVVNYQDISWGEPPPLAPGDPCPLRRFLGSETPRVNLQKTYRKLEKSQFLMGNLTISMAIFNTFLYV